MAQKPETTFYTSVHRHLNPKLHKEKMCNPFSGGTWDCWYSGAGADLWVEYKFVALPKRDSTFIEIELSALQKEWGEGRLCEGRNLAVIIGCKEGGVILRDREWLDKFTLADFRLRIIDRAAIARWITEFTGGPP